MSRVTITVTVTVVAATLALAAGDAAANPRPLPFSYPYETLPTGKIEVEQYADLVPLRVPEEQDDGTMEGVTRLRAELQTELEMGFTDRLEGGWYFVFAQSAEDGALSFEGVKQRLRYRLGEAGAWPVNVGLYFEAAEFREELELEQKLILARRFGAVNVVANLVLEQEYEWAEEKVALVYTPTFGVTYELSPHFIAGAEYRANGNIPLEDDQGSTSRHYVGPTFLAQSGELFLSLGVYVRVDNLGDDIATGDPYGRVWIRTLLGIGL